MSDDDVDRKAYDADRKAGSVDYDLEGFPQRHGITVVDAQGLFKRFGDDRTALDDAATKLRFANAH